MKNCPVHPIYASRPQVRASIIFKEIDESLMGSKPLDPLEMVI
jgi:hypothetical protein